MRKFSSYGQINPNVHYYAPRTALIEHVYTQLVGEVLEEGGHYITVWAPRQTGKSSVMLEVLKKLKTHGEFETAILSMQSAKEERADEGMLALFVRELRRWFKHDFPNITAWKDLPELFTKTYFAKPVILMIDEFDAIQDLFINKFANEFRNIYITRNTEANTHNTEKQYLLHGLALIGVRSVLGIENVTGSPFNVQRSVHIPNLTFAEVEGLFKQYEQESGQPVEQAVIERLYNAVNGHPGLTCWFGELLTETYNQTPDAPITAPRFEYVEMWATQGLPNNTILNILSKAKQSPYKETVLQLFETRERREFRYDDPELNFLYLNGVIDIEATPANLYVKFPSPFVQKRLFHYFAGEYFKELGRLIDPFDSLADAITPQALLIPNLLRRYQEYVRTNHAWLFQHAPRRADLRITEAVYHFNIYLYLHHLLHRREAKVWPEFPTGNGKLDILIIYREQLYGIEVKSFSDLAEYQQALGQAARYGKQLGLREMTLVFFIEAIAEEHRRQYEVSYQDAATGVSVQPVFIETGM